MKYNYSRRVQYYETDQMGVVHHSNYIRWFEEARTAFLEEIGCGYKEMEERGIISPVVSISAEYKTMTKYYDDIDIELTVPFYNGIKIIVNYVVKDKESGQVRCTGESKHCFIKNGSLISLKKEEPATHKILEQTVEKEEEK
ncbi:MAG: acyl-CoA thioesterase [Sphaerochaetaceae bacterium]|nr:acyl-CoA thioesterase [Sphaerochaetaceae bacterium]